jgi:hypothetical protein
VVLGGVGGGVFGEQPAVLAEPDSLSVNGSLAASQARYDADRDGIAHGPVGSNDPLDLFDGPWADGRGPSLQFGVVTGRSVQIAQFNVQLGPPHGVTSFVS